MTGSLFLASVLSAATVLLDFEDPSALVIHPRPRWGWHEGTLAITNAYASTGRHSFYFGSPREAPATAGYACTTLELKAGVDFTKYDRAMICYFHAGDAGDSVRATFRGEGIRAQADLRLPAYDIGRWIFPLKWQGKDGVRPTCVDKLDLVTGHPKNLSLFVDRVMLLEKGEPDPVDPISMTAEQREGARRARETDRIRIAAEAAEKERRRLVRQRAFREALATSCRAAGLPTDRMLLGKATSMDQVRPRETDVRLAAAARDLSLRLARGEHESFQLLVMSADGRPLKGVRVRAEVEGLTNIACTAVGYVNATNETCYRQAYCVPTNAPAGYARLSRRTPLGWYADPLPPFLRAADVAPLDVQSFWVRVRCPADASAGVHRGTLTVEAEGEPARKLPFAVRVNGFALPKASPLPLAVTFGPMVFTSVEQMGTEGVRRFEAIRRNPSAPVNLWKRREAEWGATLADYYITMSSIYHSSASLPHRETLKRLRDEGRLGNFCLGYYGAVTSDAPAVVEAWRARTLPRLRRNLEDAKELGIEKLGYIYGCDEAVPAKFDGVARAVAILKDEFPDVPVATTAVDDCYGTTNQLGRMDWFMPLTRHYFPETAETARRQGRQVWWYVACGEHPPWANLFVESLPSEGRLLMGAQAWRMKTQGFLYYEMTIWQTARPMTAAEGPFTSWPATTWQPSKAYDGDGTWIYCGEDGVPVPTIRLENFRDGLEDYAYLKLLREKYAARTDKSDAWAKAAEAALAIPADVMVDMKTYTDDPVRVLAWRDRMADLIEAASGK